MIGIVSYLVFFLILALIFGIAVLGLNLQWGYTGLFNAGVAGFVGIGAYTMAILTGPARDAVFGGFELPFIVGLIGSMFAAGLAALIVGLVTLKLNHEYLAVSTFGIAVSIQLVFLNWEYLTGGTLGLISIPNPSKTWAEGPLAQNVIFLSVVLICGGIAFWALERIVKSPWGRTLKAIREDEVAATSLGKNPARIRLESFIIGCMIMGLSGALYVSFIGYVSPWDFLPILTFQIWTMLIVGGSGNNRGAVLGALIVWGVWTSSGFVISRVIPSEIQAQGGAMQAILIGLILVVTLLIRPRGLLGEELHVSRHAQF